MARSIYLLFGVVAYLIFFATFLYLIGFVGNLPWVPRTVDTSGAIAAPALAAVVDVALIALFGLQQALTAGTLANGGSDGAKSGRVDLIVVRM